MTLCSMPFDVLLAIYRKLDTRDVARCSMVCTALHESTKDYHVWLDQLQNCIARNTVLVRVIPPLSSVSTEELRYHAIHQEKLRIRWNRVQCQPERFAYGPGWFEDRGSMWLLAGGKTVLFVSERGTISLHRIRACRECLDVTPFASFTLEGGNRWVWTALVSENVTCPLLACHKEESNCSVQLVSVNHGCGVIRPEVATRIPKEKALVRLACDGPWRTTIEAMLPESAHASFLCLPRPGMAVIYNQFDITCFELADPLKMEEGDHVVTLTALWTRPDPLARTALIYHVSLAECADASRSTSPTFEARFVEYGRDGSTDTFVSWKVGSLGPSVQNSTLEKISDTITHPDGPRCFPVSTHDHFWSAVAVDDGISFFITPLDDVGRENKWGTLQFNVPYTEFCDGGSAGVRVMYLDQDIDSVSGRVVIWWSDEEYPGRDFRTQFFILDLIRDLHPVAGDCVL